MAYRVDFPCVYTVFIEDEDIEEFKEFGIEETPEEIANWAEYNCPCDCDITGLATVTNLKTNEVFEHV